MAFVATNKTPGVYIDEIQLPGPIAGVSTSNVAIVGPAEMGPTNVPTLVTNPTQFIEKFGGYLYAPSIVQATHAVHGFFRNGGTTCYFVRIGTAKAAKLELKDIAGVNTTLVVTAKADGEAGNNIQVQVVDAPVVKDVKIDFLVPITKLTEKTVAAKAKVEFVSGLTVGDNVKLVGKKESDNTDHEETAKITAIDAAGKELTFAAALASVMKSAVVNKITDVKKTSKTIKVEDIKGIEPGTGLTITAGATSEKVVVQSISKSARLVTLESGLGNDYPASVETKVESNEFTLKVGPTESFENMSMDSRHSRHFKKIVATSALVHVTEPDKINPTPAPDNRPAVLAATALADGANDNIANHALNHYADGINALEKVDAVNMLCVPDRADPQTHGLMIEHCEKMAERFAILDPPNDAADTTAMLTYRELLQSDRGFAALYFPRIKIRDPNPNFDRLIPVSPSGHLAGVYARTDNDKGVHKAPANEVIKGVVEVEHTLTDTDAGILNEQSVNILRFFRGKGFRIWGGRTIAAGTQWRYINVRRLMLFIEESIQEASEQFVFDPNNLSLWKTIERQVNGFLTGVWQTGALFGESPKKAFRVRIDEELNPPEARALGILTVEVIVFPTTPAEYIVFRVLQEPGGPRLVEI